MLPRLVRDQWVTTPLVVLLGGLALFALPLPLPRLEPLESPDWTEYLTEVGVIVSLMGAGLKLDRHIGWRSWTSTWRLLAITMPVTIAATALLGWWMLGLAPAAAMLLGAALAPTDPVLAADVQVGPPGAALEDTENPHDAEDEVRFALTSEAGLNDALAFPFTGAAVAMATAGAAPAAWLGDWLVFDVAYKLAVGLAAGLAIGWLLGRLVFSSEGEVQLAKRGEGFVALAGTFVAYGLTELVGGYGFLAVFVAAVTLRRSEHGHEYHETLHEFAEQTERMLMIGLLLLLGGAIAGGVLAPLTVPGAALILIVLLVIRPVSAWFALSSDCVTPPERATIAFFGIRGIGSLYYMAYALNHATFAEAEQLWAVVAATVGVSVVLHGLAVTPAMRRLDRMRSQPSPAG